MVPCRDDSIALSAGWDKNHGDVKDTMQKLEPRVRPTVASATHIEIRDVDGTSFVSFNGVVQCAIDYPEVIF